MIFQQETRYIEQELKLSDRVVFITGASSGTGLQIALAASGEGARIGFGTRKKGNFDNLVAQFANGPFPVVGDISDPREIISEIKRLKREGVEITDVVHAAAGGLEPILFNLMKKLIVPWRKKPIADEEKLPAIQKVVENHYQEAMRRSEKINYEGPKRFVEELISILPNGSRFIFLSSLWSSFYGQVTTPHFYEPIASLKKRFEEFMVSSIGDFVFQGVYPAIVSGNLLTDTDLGKTFEDLQTTVPGSITFMTNEPLPTTNNMARATMDLLVSDPTRWGSLPAYRFVTRPNTIMTDLQPTSPVFQQFRVNF